MRKLFLVFLSLVLTLNSFAATGGEALAILIDDFQYTLTVDWDQKDQDKYEQYTKSFYERLDKLTQEQGLTTQEIEKTILEKIKNPKVLEAIKLKIKLMGNNPSREQVLRLVKDESRNMYAQGSNWAGEAIVMIPLVAMVGLLIYAVVFSLTHKCVQYEQTDRYTCTENTACVDSYASVGPCTNIGLGTYNCGYEDRCVKYEKR